MAESNADRNLLFGIIAHQMRFVTRDQLIAAMQAWVGDKTEPIAQLLCRQGALADDTRALLDALVDKHLAQHGNDPHKSLAAIGAAGSVTEQLQQCGDPQVQASLAHLRTAPVAEADDPYATRPSQPDLNIAASERPAPTRPPSQGDLSSGGVRFRILRPHARGGLGEVHVARDAELNREVALKQIQPHYANDADSQGRFVLEAEITGGLEHPGIVPVYGLGQYADGRPFYAMRFIRGDSLKEAIERFHQLDSPGRDPGERSLEVRGLLGRFVDVCNAIAYAHSRGVLHRDLKPGNIMLGKYGETLVVDWGLAKPLDAPEPERPGVPTQPGEGTLRPMSASYASRTLVGSAIGTPQFMSPEQAAGRLHQLGPASDVYSLGATLYSLLTGATPVPDMDVATVLEKVQRGDIRPPRQVKPSVPLPLDAICRKAMALAPANRYASPRDLADDIEHWLADEPVSAWREPWTVRARRWISRHRTFVTGAVSAIAVTIISLAVATVLLTAAYERETAAHAQTEQQRQLALHNYQLARKAVDRYHTEVSESVLLHEPGMEPLRERLLQSAREFYATFVQEHGHEPGLEAEYGRALFRLAQITGDIGSQPDAIKLHRQAAQVFTALPAEEAATPEAQSDLASCWHHLGRLSRLTDQLPEAEDAYKKAIAIWGPLRKAHPDDDRYRAELARSQMGLGSICQVTRRLADAKQLYEMALESRVALATAHREATYQRDLAVNHSNLARVLKAQAEPQKAKEAYRAAQAIQERLVRDHATISQYQNDLARTHFNLGELASHSGLPWDAEEPFLAAARIWGGLVEKHPAVTEFHTNLAETYAALASVYSAAKAAVKAAEAAKKALDINQRLVHDYPDNPRFQRDLARGNSRLGNVYRAGEQVPQATAAYEEAVRILEDLVRARPNVAQYQADLARTCNSLGLLHLGINEVARAEAAFRKALALWDQLALAHPEELEFVTGYSMAAVNLAIVLRTAGNPLGALDLLARALRPLDTLSAEQRRGPAVNTALRDAYWRRAETLMDAGRHAEALEEWDRAIALAGKQQGQRWQFYRTVALARSGAHAQAAADAENLIPVAAGSGEGNYQLACAFARAAAAVRDDSKLQLDQRQMLGDRYVALAVERLRAVQATAFFKSAANRARLKKDADFDAIRTHPEFRNVVQGIDAAANLMN